MSEAELERLAELAGALERAKANEGLLGLLAPSTIDHLVALEFVIDRLYEANA